MYILLAILGLGILVFVHELGHYFVARWVGMRVEAFGIGFGRPILTWKWQGVDWNLCWLPFGGYVRIAGTERIGDTDPYDIPDGFFGRGAWPRILVAAAGPVANFILALLVLTMLWFSGGRQKSFSDTTDVVGWVDPKSELYTAGVRPGDHLLRYGQYSFKTQQDHIRLPMFVGDTLTVDGIDRDTGAPFSHTINSYLHPALVDKGIRTAGILASAGYVIYDRLPDGQDNPLTENSPMVKSGIQYGDRIYWMDGERIYSAAQLSHLLNDNRSLLTVRRGDETLMRRVPRVSLDDMKLDSGHRDELSDWQYEAGMRAVRSSEIEFIPYNLDNNGLVESAIAFLDVDQEEELGLHHPYSELEEPLAVGDRIVAVDGRPIRKSYQLLQHLQTPRVNIIVERGVPYPTIPWGEQATPFDANDDDLARIADSLGGESVLRSAGRFVLLNPVTPAKWLDLAATPEQRAELTHLLLEQRMQLEQIEDADNRARALELFDDQQDRLVMGIPAVQDRMVQHNPNPFVMFGDVCQEIWRTLKALFSGSLSPKFLAGPVGIVQVLQVNWMVGAKEAIFWLAAISINLGLLNLLPVPVLDGGYIFMSLFELVTRKKLNTKTIETLVTIFAILLIFAMAVFTFNDLSRIFQDVLRG